MHSTAQLMLSLVNSFVFVIVETQYIYGAFLLAISSRHLSCPSQFANTNCVIGQWHAMRVPCPTFLSAAKSFPKIFRNRPSHRIHSLCEPSSPSPVSRRVGAIELPGMSFLRSAPTFLLNASKLLSCTSSPAALLKPTIWKRGLATAFDRSLPHLNIGTIGHVDHGKTTLTAVRPCFTASV